jgi:hypothetical protein
LCCSAEPRALDLAALATAAQLLDELRALREACGAERMALREQAARRVGHHLAAIGVVAVAMNFSAPPGSGQRRSAS